MARFNPYGNSQIADSISSIAKALIGSADTDAALARANASNASAKSYLAQARERAANADILESLAKAGEGLSNNPKFQGIAASVLGVPTLPESYIGPPAPNQMRLGTEAMSNLARTILGEYGTANQMSEAFSNIGLGNQEMLAGNLILGGTPEQAQRGALFKAPTGGKYQNPSMAATELADTLANELQLQKLKNKAEIEAARIAAAADKYAAEAQYGPEGSERAIADIKATAEKEWQNYKTDVGLESDKFQANKKLEADNYATDKRLEAENYKTDKTFELGEAELADKKALETKRIETEDDTARLKITEEIKFEKWKFQNETLEMVVEPGKQIVLSPKAGERLGLTPNDQGLYILDGGPKRDSVTIKVGDDDVYLTKEQAEAIGIKPNAEGIYMIPGKAKAGSKANKFGATEQKRVQDVAKQTMEDLGIDLTPRVQTAIMASLEEEAAKRFQESNNINSATGYVVSKLNEQFNGQVVVSLDDRAMLNPTRMYQDGLNVPAFVMNEIQGIMATATDEAKGRKAKDDANQKLQKYGFTAPEILKILNSFR